MKFSVVGSMLVLGVLTTSCISLPTLTVEQKTLAGYIADTVCLSAAMNESGLTEEGMQMMVDKYGENMAEGFNSSEAALYLQDEKKVEEITQTFAEDPLVAGLFVKEVTDSLVAKCGLQEGGEAMKRLSEQFGAK